ncbi:hypothetical protein D3C73_1024070 [compost metagenome]
MNDVIDILARRWHILAGNPFHHVLVEYRRTFTVNEFEKFVVHMNAPSFIGS